MKKHALLIALVLSAFVMFGCKTTIPGQLGSNKVGSKVGEASAQFLFGYLPLGDGDFSLKTAASKAGITEIGTVDYRVEWPLVPIIITLTTVVTGE